MAELHALAGGPMDEFTNALAQLVQDLNDRTAELDEEYNERTLFHQSEITRLAGLISDAQIDVSSTINLLENVLYSARATLNGKLDSFNNNINENNKYIEKITFEREQNNEAYNARVTEHNNALAAVDECLKIIEEVSGGSISFVQARSLKTSFNKAVDSLPKGTDEVMIKALVTLATEEFADMGALLKVSNALKGVKQTIQDALQEEHDEEARSVQQYTEERKDKENEIKAYQRDIFITEGELKVTEDRIAAKEAFLSLRQSDLKNANQDLDSENTSFDDATNSYTDIRTQLERETAVANDALKLVANAGFAASLSKNGV